jgi:hypothetical protein
MQLLHIWILLPRRRSEVEESPEICVLSQGADQNRVDLLGGDFTTRKQECKRVHGPISVRNAHSHQCRSQPPTLLLAYLPSLTAASCQLLDRFLSDPTAYGVSLAFVESEQQLEEAFLPWCSVIGSAFTNSSRSRSTGSIGPRKLIKQARSRFPLLTSGSHPKFWTPIRSVGGPNGNTVAKVFRRLSRGSTPSRSLSGDNSSTGSLTSDSAHSSECHTSSPPPKSEWLDHCPLYSDIPTRRSSLVIQPTNMNYTPATRDGTCRALKQIGPREPSRICSFRELAILPTQRVMRYVLLFRGTVSLPNSVDMLVTSTISDRSSRQHARNLLQPPSDRGGAGGGDENC